MDLDRGTLSKIDRRVLSGLGHDERWQMVRVPASDATWSAWKRYCDSLGLSMGRAIATLIEHELRSVVDDVGGGAVFLCEREAEIAKRQRMLATPSSGSSMECPCSPIGRTSTPILDP